MKIDNSKRHKMTRTLAAIALIYFAFTTPQLATAQAYSAQEIRFLCAGASTSIFEGDSAAVSGNRDGLVFRDQQGKLSVFVGDDLLGTVEGADYQAYTKCVLDLASIQGPGVSNDDSNHRFAGRVCTNPAYDENCMESNFRLAEALDESVGDILEVDVEVYDWNFAPACFENMVVHVGSTENINLWRIPLSDDCGVDLSVELKGAQGLLARAGNGYRIYRVRGQFFVASFGSAATGYYELTAQ